MQPFTYGMHLKLMLLINCYSVVRSMIRAIYYYLHIRHVNLVLTIVIILAISGKNNAQPCQHIDAFFDTLVCNPSPVAHEGFLYFNNCFTDSILFVAKGIYIENNTNYYQHDTLSTFHWDFGDGTTQITDVPYVKHRYLEPKGYEMNMVIYDQLLCSSIPAVSRIRVSGNPIVSTTNPPASCQFDTVYLSASNLSTYTPFEYTLSSSQKFDSIMFVPDGPACPPGFYNTFVTFKSFIPGQTITSASDVLSVCVLMEHSYLGDLGFKLICPNGQSTHLKPNIHNGGADLGIPGYPDNGCTAINNGIGTPWNYCWSEIYPNLGTMNLPANYGQAVLDSTNRVNNTDYYLPVQPFSNLVGCPLNGQWNIEILDDWSADNGYIFEWTLNLDPALLPASWGFQVEVDSTWCVGPNIVGHSGDSAIVVVNNPGNYDYTINVLDSYGCVWDTTITLHVNTVPDISLPTIVDICQGESVLLYSNVNCNNCIYNWSTGQNTPSIVVTTSGQYSLELIDPNGCSNYASCNVIVHTRPPLIPIKHN